MRIRKRVATLLLYRRRRQRLDAAMAHLGGAGALARPLKAEPRARRPRLHHLDAHVLFAAAAARHGLALGQVPLVRIRRLALALEVSVQVRDVGPALVGAAGGVGLAHEVGALVVAHGAAGEVGVPRGHGGGALEGHVLGQRVGEVLGGGGAEGLGVGGLDGLDGRGLGVRVARGEDGVEGAGVVVERAGVVERVDGVAGLLAVRGAQVGGAVGGAGLPLDHVEGAVGHVAGVALAEGAFAAGGFAIGVGRWGGRRCPFVDGLVEDVSRVRYRAGVSKGYAPTRDVLIHVGMPSLRGGHIERLSPVVAGLPRRRHGLSVKGGVGHGDAVSPSENGALVPASLGWLRGVEKRENIFLRVQRQLGLALHAVAAFAAAGAAGYGTVASQEFVDPQLGLSVLIAPQRALGEACEKSGSGRTSWC